VTRRPFQLVDVPSARPAPSPAQLKLRRIR